MANTPLTNLDTVTSTDRTAAGSQPDFSTPTGTTGTGGGGGSPTGAAGGDLGGFYPNPKVLGLTANTVPLTYGPISSGQYLLRSGSNIIGGTPSGAGNVNGPSSSLDNHVALFNGTSGTAIKDSGVTLTAGTGTPALTVNGTADVSGSNTGDQTNISGNAGTASALNPGATINSVNFTGTAAITVYDATKLPLAGGTMSGNISMNGFVLTNLAAGTSANDSVRYSQIPTSLPPSGLASGDLSGNYPGPQVTLLHTNTATHTAFMGPISGSGLPAFRTLDSSDIPALPYVSSTTAQAINKVLAGPITGASAAPTFRSLDKSDIPATISSDTTGNAASATILKTTRTINTVGFNGSADITIADDTKLPLSGGTMTGPINMGAKKITNISNGSDSSDAAAFGQIPTKLPPNGAAGGSLGGSYPDPTVTAINETSGPQKLTIGAVSDGQVLKRSGTTLIGASVGTGDVTGPGSSVAGRVATFSTTSGKVIQDSGVSISDVVVQGGNATLSIAAITQLKLDPQLGYPTGGPITFDLSTSRNRIALTVNLTVSATSNRASNVSSMLELYNSTSSNLTITWSQYGTWKANGTLPSVIGPGETMQFLFQCWGTTENDVSVQYISPSTFPKLNVRSFGAKGDGSTDDTAAIGNALDAAIAMHGNVYFPSGVYILTNTITKTFGSVGSFYGLSIYGDGIGCSIIKQTGSNKGVFDLTCAGRSGCLSIEGLGFWNNSGLSGSPCIKYAVSQEDNNDSHPNLRATNLFIGAQSGANSWTIGLDLYNIHNGYINGIQYYGDLAGGGTGIVFQKYGSNETTGKNKSMACFVQGSQFNLCGTGIKIKDSMESCLIQETFMVGVVYGVNADYCIHLSVVNCHINCNGGGTGVCIYGSGTGSDSGRFDQFVCQGSLLYSQDTNTTGINAGMNRSSINGNSFVCPANASGTKGLVITGGEGVCVSGNSFNWHKVSYVEIAANYSLVSSNNATKGTGLATNQYVSTGTGNNLVNNYYQS
jgi:hypothetical protein